MSKRIPTTSHTRGALSVAVLLLSLVASLSQSAPGASPGAPPATTVATQSSTPVHIRGIFDGYLYPDDVATSTPTTTPIAIATGTPTPSLTDVPTLTPAATVTDTPTSTPTATTVATTYDLGVGPRVASILHPTGMNIWSPALVVSQTAQLPKLLGMGVTEIRLMGLGGGTITGADDLWSGTDRAVDVLLRVGLRPAFAFASRDYPAEFTTAEKAARVASLLSHLLDRYGVSATAWRLEGGNEEPNETEVAWYRAVVSATLSVEANYADVLKDQRFILCTPAPVTGGYSSLERMLRAVGDEHLRADGVAVHWYGQAADLTDHFTRVSGLVARYMPAGTPLYLTEWAMAGHRTTDLRTNINAAWVANQLARPELSGYAGMNFSAAIGQSFGYTDTTGTPAGFLGTVALGSDHAMYPVGRLFELWNRLGQDRMEVSGLPAASVLHALTDERNQWLLWNTEAAPLTATLPCTTALSAGVIGPERGNSYAVWTTMVAERGGKTQGWSQVEADRLHVRSDPFRLPADGTVAPPLACVQGRATVVVPGPGVVFVGTP